MDIHPDTTTVRTRSSCHIRATPCGQRRGNTPMTRNTRGILAVIGGSAAVFWPGALTYTYPGIMAPYWQQAFGVSKGTIGTAVFVALPMAGIFMFVAGKLQEKFGTRWMTRIGALA